jgi:hypothetical protein
MCRATDAARLNDALPRTAIERLLVRSELAHADI